MTSHPRQNRRRSVGVLRQLLVDEKKRDVAELLTVPLMRRKTTTTMELDQLCLVRQI
jgi:hypothetical protein